MLGLHLDMEEEYKKYFEEIEFRIYKGNPKIISALLGVRYSLFIISIIMAVLYTLHYLKIDPEDKTIEHKLIMILGFSLILFNDPFYGVVLKKPNSFWFFLNTLFVVQFVSYCLFFWLVMAKRIAKNEVTRETRFLTKREILIAVFLFVFLLIPSLLYNLREKYHPAYYNELNMGLEFVVFLVTILLMLVVYWVFIIYYSCFAISRSKKLLKRHKFYLCFSLATIIYFFLIFVTGFYHYLDPQPGKTIVYFISTNFYVFLF